MKVGDIVLDELTGKEAKLIEIGKFQQLFDSEGNPIKSLVNVKYLIDNEYLNGARYGWEISYLYE